MRTLNDWTALLSGCGVRGAIVAIWAPVFTESITDSTFSAGNADLVPFVAQMLVETQMLEKLSENLNYSAERLMAVWPHRFPTLAEAQPYAHNPEALANKVYGGRMGNVDPGDGYKYRGRGIPMVTGRDGYVWLGSLMGQDLESNPELLEQPHFAFEGGVHWWEQHVPDAILGDTEKVTHAVNGGEIGLAEREKLTDLARVVLA